MRIPGTKFYPAHSSNYTKGRGGNKIEWFTVHHTAANNTTLRYLWADPNRNGSSHIGVFKGYAEQYVDTSDTAWTNGRWSSNQTSITCEVTGDWRGTYYNQSTLNTLTEVMYQCLKVFPQLKLNYHKDVSIKTTLCPANLKDKGYAQDCWNKAKNRIELENTPQPATLRVDIPDKKVILIRDANVWDMSFTKFSDAKAVVRLQKGTVVDVAGVYDHPLSSTDYYLSKYSWDRNLNNGISKADCKNYTPPVPPKPPEPPKEVPPVDNPTEEASDESPTGGQGPQEPEDNDVINGKLDKILAIVTKIWEAIKGIFKIGEINDKQN